MAGAKGMRRHFQLGFDDAVTAYVARAVDITWVFKEKPIIPEGAQFLVYAYRRDEETVINSIRHAAELQRI